jgi:predicted ArsR family transcriptional regulator
VSIALDHDAESTRGQIIDVLRRGASTVEAIVSQLGLSPNAVRVQLTRMQRDGLIRRAGVERRTTRPAHLFELTDATQQLLSRAYVPFLAEIVRVLSLRQPPAELERVMRAASKSLAERYRGRIRPRATVGERIRSASTLLNTEFGAFTEVATIDGEFVIRGHGCPLAAVTGGHPAVCRGVETLVSELVDARARECCRRQHPPQCCFRIRPPRPATIHGRRS